MNKYKPLSLAAILALMFTLSACSEQLLETVAEDPEPDTTSGEADYVTSQVLAQNSADDERSPQPNDITLGSYNNSTGSNVVGQHNLMPIRIPFNGAITDLYDDNGSLNTTAASAYISNIAILEWNGSTVTGAVIPLPVYDRAGGTVSTLLGNTIAGTFKSIYQDSNHELVLVPSAETFKSTTADINYSYFVLVHKGLNGADDQNIIPDTLTQLLTSSERLIDETGTKINSSLLEDADGDGIDNDPDDINTVLALEGARQGYVGENGNGGMLAATKSSAFADLGFNFTSNSDIASAFHFTTSADTSAEIYNAIDGMFGIAASTTIDEDLMWLNATLDGTSTSAIDLKSTVEGLLGASFNAVSVIYKGFFSCTNFLENEGNDTTISATGADSERWDLNGFNKVQNYSGDPATLADCPNAIDGLDGKIGFWVTTPVTESGTTPYGTVVFQHGITANKDNLFAIANTLANYGYSTVAIDIWGHGERTYEDGDDDGVIENTLETSYADSGALFIRPDAPDLSAGYYLQTLVDIYRLSSFISNNPGLSQAVGTNTPIHYVGMSLGGIMGASLSSISSITDTTSTNNFSNPFEKYVLNVPGGDISDIVLNGSFGASVRNSVATAYNYDTSTVEGQQSLSSTMVAIDLLTSNTLFTYAADPLASITSDLPTQVLVQEILGDEVVPNNTTELMAQAMNLANHHDGDAAFEISENNQRNRWTLDPSNYDKENDGGDAGHGFLLDDDTSATAQGQLQVACYLLFNRVLNTKATINPETCTNL